MTGYVGRDRAAYRPAGSPLLRRTSSTVMAGMYISGNSDLGH
jgi:hypothetical protein